MTKNFIETFINGGNLCILIAKLEMIILDVKLKCFENMKANVTMKWPSLKEKNGKFCINKYF